MKIKKILIMLTVVVLSMMFVSCSTPLEVGGGTEVGPNTIEQANNALADGDITTAKNAYTEVLQTDPGNVEANAGYAITESVEQMANIADVMNQLGEVEMSAAISRSIGENTNTWNEIGFEEVQKVLTSEILPVLEDAREKLEYVLENLDESGNHTLKYYPNKNDWNNDRLKSSTTSLNFNFELYENSSEKRVWWVLFNPPENAVINDEVFYELLLDPIFDASKIGDAWFDKETVEYIATAGILPDGYTPVFNDNDYIELNENEINLLLMMINAQLMMLEPLVIYDLAPDQEFITDLEALYSADIATAVQTCRDIDTDNDGVISNAELQALMGDSFLEFLNHDEGGLNAISDWKDVILDFVALGVELAGTEGYDLENKQLIIELLTQLEAYVTDTNEKIGLPNLIDDDAEMEYLVIAAFFENAGNFSNLKDFLPSIDYPEISLNPNDWNITFSFEDATLGGILENFTDTYTINLQDFLTF